MSKVDMNEKELIDKYSHIELISSKMLVNGLNFDLDKRYEYYGQLQQAFIQYGEVLEQYIDWMKEINSITEIEEHVRILLDNNISRVLDMVGYCEEICELLYELVYADDKRYDDLLERFRYLEGRIAIILRYELLSDCDLEANTRGLDRAADILNETSCLTGDYYPIHILPNRQNRHFLPSYEIDDTAIILQGQIKYEDDFTLETLYRYRRLYPKTPIIVSTWKKEVREDFRWRAQTIGVDIVENDYPEEKGKFNINCQLITSYEGVKYSKDKFCAKYAIKMRSDQRFYLPDFLQYLKNEINLFPVKTNGRIEGRIILNGSGASVWSFPFRLADYWAFGTTNDLIKLYSAKHSPKLSTDAYKKLWENIAYDNEQAITSMPDEVRILKGREHKELNDSEVYIARTYYEEYILGRKLDYDIDDVYTHYWNFLRDYVIIEDPQLLIMYWPKYKSKYFEYDCNTSTGSLTHTSWLDLVISGESTGR